MLEILTSDYHPPANIVLNDAGVNNSDANDKEYVEFVVRMVHECVYSKVVGVGWSAWFTPPVSAP